MKEAGHPLRVCEMLAALDGPAYLERVSLDSPKNVLAAKKAIRKAFLNQIEGTGFSLVEALALCPTDWGMTPIQALDWVRDHMMQYYPLGVYTDRIQKTEDRGQKAGVRSEEQECTRT